MEKGHNAAMGRRVFMKSVGKPMSGDSFCKQPLRPRERVHWLRRLSHSAFGFQT
jgi:hypothetical protein